MDAGKFFLKGTSKQSLNDRFTKLIKARPKALQQQPVQKKPSPMAQAQKSSAKNRRLALQMENRPAVRAALGLEQRLGARPKRGTVKNRLGQPGGRGKGRLVSRGALQRGASQVTTQRGRGRGRANFRASLRGIRRGGSYRTGAVQKARLQGALRGRGRGNFKRGNRAFQNTRVQSFQNTATRGARGARGRGHGRGRGRGRGRGAAQSVSKEDLDDQLDAYMSNTRGSLDAELDAYMANTT